MDFHRPDMKLGDNDVVHNGQQLIDQKLSADVTEARKMNFNAVLLSNFKNRFALVVAIAMTVITASCFVGAILYGNFISSAINICIGSIALVDCFGIWKLFAYDKEITPEGLKSFQRYASVQKVMNVVSMILFGLLAGIMIVISIALMIAFEQFSGNISEVVHSVGTLLDYQIPMDSEAISSFFIVGPTIIFITALIVIIFVTVYYTLINRALKNVIKYVDRLAACANGDVNYAIDQKPPFISLLVFSGVNALLTLLIPTDIGLWSIVYNLTLCVYFVFIALLFRNIHKEIEKQEATYIGTAVHKFMELCDLEKLDDGSVEAELNRLVAEGDISSDDAEHVQLRINEIEKFRRSKLFEEMRQAKELHREYRIETESEISIIDCIIVKENGDILLADYKTDRQPEEQFVDEYTAQLSKYVRAIKSEFGKAPLSAEIYSFHLGKSIKVEIPKQTTDKYVFSMTKGRPS